MPRYRIEFEFDAPDDGTALRVVALAQVAAPVLESGGERCLRETARPWLCAETLKQREVPRRRPPRVLA